MANNWTSLISLNWLECNGTQYFNLNFQCWSHPHSFRFLWKQASFQVISLIHHWDISQLTQEWHSLEELKPSPFLYIINFLWIRINRCLIPATLNIIVSHFFQSIKLSGILSSVRITMQPYNRVIKKTEKKPGLSVTEVIKRSRNLVTRKLNVVKITWCEN